MNAVKSVLLAGAAALAMAAPVRADIIPIASGPTDPTDLHISGPGATGVDPVVVPNTSEFFLDSVNNTTTVNQPIDIFFAEPNGAAAPTITSVTGPGGTSVGFTAPTLLTATLGPGQNLYTQVGCAPCDNSLSFSNFTGALAALTPPISGVTSFSLYEATLTSNLLPQTQDDIFGSFALGTFIAPLGLNGTTVFDTSFTNTGLIGHTSVSVPAPLVGHGLLALLAIGSVLFGGWFFERRKEGLA